MNDMYEDEPEAMKQVRRWRQAAEAATENMSPEERREYRERISEKLQAEYGIQLRKAQPGIANQAE